MDTVINRLSDIEKAAVSVMDGASERKKQMAREMRKRRLLMHSWKKKTRIAFPRYAAKWKRNYSRS